MSVIWLAAGAAGALIVVFIFVRLFRHLLERRTLAWQNRLLSQNVEEVRSIYARMRGWRHDYHSHLQTLKAYLAEEKLTEAREYLDRLETDLDEIRPMVESGNVNLDAILNAKLTLAISQDIQVFSVRISNSESLSPEAQALVDLAEATGGFDTCLRPDGSGSVDTADLLAAFQAAFQASTEDQLVMEEELLIASSHASLYQLLIRLVTLIAIGVLFGIGYYAQIHLRTLLYNALSGAMLTAAVSILGSSAVLCMVLCCLLLAAAYVALEQNGGDTLDV